RAGRRSSSRSSSASRRAASARATFARCSRRSSSSSHCADRTERERNPPVHLVKFFLRLSPINMTLAIVAGAISGFINVLFIIALNRMMRGHPGSAAAWRFFGLSLTMLVTRLVSERVLLKLSQRQVHLLRLELCRQIIRVPLRQMELLGSHPLLTALTED